MDETQASQYVLGFLFNENLTEVVLIRKQRPEWQRNFLNGVGGKIEEGETPLDAMIRECREETGLEVSNWLRFGSMWPSESHVTLFAAIADICHAKTMTDERVEILSIGDLILVVPNLFWLIPIAKYAISNSRANNR